MACMTTDAGVENRGRFIIDPDGVIQAYEVLTPPVGRRVSETLRQIQAFQLVRESEGRRGYAVRLDAWQAHAQTGTRPCGQGVGSLDNRHGRRIERVCNGAAVAQWRDCRPVA